MPGAGTRYGLIGGFLSVLYLTILYIAFKPGLVGPPLLAVYFIFLLAMVVGAWRFKVENDGVADFKQALQAAFKVFLIGNLLVSLYTFFLFSFDTSLGEIYRQYELNNLNTLKGTMATAEFEEKLNIITQMAVKPTFLDIFVRYFFQAIFGFFAAAIVGLFIKSPQQLNNLK